MNQRRQAFEARELSVSWLLWCRRIFLRFTARPAQVIQFAERNKLFVNSSFAHKRMSFMSIAVIALAILWLALIAYAVLGGADFGAGIWDLFAIGAQRQRHRQLINQAIGPVWEANHVWLIFLIVGLFSVFPSAFAVLTVALFIPLTIALIGIVLRGAAF